MKKRPNQILCVIFAFAFILMMGMGHLSAQVPSLLEYDGYLTGNITGNRTIGVRLYNAPTNGNLLYSETIGQVNITNGEFYFQYGQNGTAGNSAMPITIADALTGSQHWLALIINGVEQSPRERLLAVPFALKAKQSDDVQQLTQDLSMVTQAVGRTINVLGGTYSSVSGNLSAAVATLETKASQIQSLQNEGRVIGLSGNFSFGSATLQSNSTRTLTITNSGYAKLNVSGITLPSGFRGTWSGVINSGASQNVTVTFNPSGAQIYSGNITVNSDATSGNGRIPVSGLVPTRQISVSGNLSYGSVLLQGSSTRTLTITNSGNSKLNVSRITLPSGFSGTWSGAINPASSQDVVVKFLPPQVKTYTGNISVASDATSGSGVLAVSGSGVNATTNVVVTTLAGSGARGFTDGTGTAASFKEPAGVTVDSSGNLYVADCNNQRIRKITPAGVVTTLAGNNVEGSIDGTGTAASFDEPVGIAVDSSGTLYVTDTITQNVRKITSAGVVTTLAGSGAIGSADGTRTAASFYQPNGVAIDSSGNVYVADSNNHKIRKITSTGVVTKFAGSGAIGSADGTGTAASFYGPVGITIDSSGNVYVADMGNNKIRKITPAGVVTTLAGSGSQGAVDGKGVAASFKTPLGIAVDSGGNLYVADSGNNKIRKITPAGVVTTLAGSGLKSSVDGTATSASFSNPGGVAVDSSGNVYVSDQDTHKIRKIVVGAVSGSGENAMAGMVAVAGGTLPQGSGLAGQVVATFQIGKYEVTWGEWKTVRDWAVTNGYSDLAGVGDTYPSGSGDNFPVCYVSWYDAVKWCNSKSEKEGKTPVYTVNGTTYKTGTSEPTVSSAANGYRLPSEKEWEWAAKGGVSSQGYIYSGSNASSAVAWSTVNSSSGTKAVGTKAANELGIHDMSGNLWEWCENLVDSNPLDLRRSSRGGSWKNGESNGFVSERGHGNSSKRVNNCGFRIASNSGN